MYPPYPQKPLNTKLIHATCWTFLAFTGLQMLAFLAMFLFGFIGAMGTY